MDLTSVLIGRLAALTAAEEPPPKTLTTLIEPLQPGIWIVLAIAVVFVVVVMRVIDWRDSPGFFYVYCCGWMVVLTVGVLYLGQKPPSTHYTWSYSFQDVLPLWVPWAGALGGSFISLAGVAKHTSDWLPKYAYWHLARPVLGAFSGTIGVLIVVLVVKSVVPSAPEDGAGTPVLYDNRGIATLAVIAFVIGFREKTFRTLIERVVDVILAPNETAAAATAGVGTVQKRLDLTTKGDAVATASVQLFNGSTDTLGLTNASVKVTPDDEGFVATPESEASLESLTARTIEVAWKPTEIGATNRADLVITLGGHVLIVPLKGVSSET